MPLDPSKLPNLDYRSQLGTDLGFDPTESIEYVYEGQSYEIHWYGAYISAYGEIHDFAVNDLPRKALRGLFNFVIQHYDLIYMSAHIDYRDEAKVENPTVVHFSIRESTDKPRVKSIPPTTFTSTEI